MPDPNAITDFFDRDHERLLVLLEAARQCQDAEQGQKLYLAFRTGLRRHMQWEEELLFPLLEPSAQELGPVASFRREHERMRVLMDAALVYEYPGAAPEVMVLKQLLEDHHSREDRLLYGVLDVRCSQEQKTRLLAVLFDALRTADDLYCLD